MVFFTAKSEEVHFYLDEYITRNGDRKLSIIASDTLFKNRVHGFHSRQKLVSVRKDVIVINNTPRSVELILNIVNTGIIPRIRDILPNT